MARRLNLQGLSRDMLPKFRAVWTDGWANVLPLIGLLVVLFSGFTPFTSAFCGISIALVTGMSRLRLPASLAYAALFVAFVIWKLQGGGFTPGISAILIGCTVLATLNPQPRINLAEMTSTFETGVKYALAVGAASAAVGIVVGVINTTSVGFRIGFLVTQGAGALGTDLHGLFSFATYDLFSVEDLTLLISFVFIALACILMGAGIPKTALYIMLVSVAQPALAQFGIPPIASHLFVLYYGVVAEITPPVCTSAYAAAAIANSNPFRTGISAFTLGLGKVVAPMAFVCAPVLLFASSTGFDVWEFAYVAASAILGVVALSAAVVGYWLVPTGWFFRILAAVAGIVFIAPSLQADVIALIIAALAIATQVVARRMRPSAKGHGQTGASVSKPR